MKQLNAMGFVDSDGELLRLVQEKQGNVAEVIDAIQKKGQQNPKPSA